MKFTEQYEELIVELDHKALVKHFTYMFTQSPEVAKDRRIKKKFKDYFKYTEKDFNAMSDKELLKLWDDYQDLQDSFNEQYDNITEKKRAPYNRGRNLAELQKGLKNNGLRLPISFNFNDQSLLWSLLDDKKKLKQAWSDISNDVHKVMQMNHDLNNRSFK